MRRIIGASIGLLALLATFPGLVLGQEIKAGVATVIEGDVTARRVAAPRPVALRFRDDVLVYDTITTAERSLARLLLGDKAIVTVRERSQLTVTEVPGTSLVELGSGKVGLAVVRQRMRPGEVVEIRTHNAVVAVRGTVVITEIVPATAAGGKSSPAASLQSNVYVLTGKVDVQELRGGVPFGPVYPVGRRQMITISPFAPPQVTSIPESRIAAITSGLQPSSKGAGGSAEQAAAKEAALRAAVSDLSAGPLDGEDRLPADEQRVRAPIVPTLPAFWESAGESPAALVIPSAQPPVPDVSPIRPPLRANVPAVADPARTPVADLTRAPKDPGAANLGAPSAAGAVRIQPSGTVNVPPPTVDLGTAGLKTNTRPPALVGPR